MSNPDRTGYLGTLSSTGIACGCALLALAWTGGPSDGANAGRHFPAKPHYRILCTSLPSGSNGGTQPGLYAAQASQSDLPLGSRIILLDSSEGKGRTVNLTPGFAAAGRPSLSFDARRLLFVAKKKADDHFQVWEMAMDSGQARQVTQVPSQVTGTSRALYLSTVFYYHREDEGSLNYIAFTGRPFSGGPGSAIFVCRPDGKDPQQITFNPCGVGDPVLLRDGRILFSSRQPTLNESSFPCEGSVLMTVYPDGGDLFLFGPAEDSFAAGSPCETTSKHIVYVERSPREGPVGGVLASLSLLRPLGSRRLLTPHGDGFYHSPSAGIDSQVLVSYRATTNETFGLYTLDVRTGRRVRAIVDLPDRHEVDAVLVRPRPRPSGRSSVVDMEARRGKLYCLDAYVSQSHSKGATHDVIRWLKIYSVERDPANRVLRESLLGTVPVEPDGSFFADVPARVPLRLETVGVEGSVLERMSSWFWVMPNESRGCVGCHEDRELAPPNRFPMALRKPPTRVELPPKDATSK